MWYNTTMTPISIPKITPSRQAQFWQRTRKVNDCWEWQGRRIKSKQPYGVFKIGTRPFLAHRVAFFLVYGQPHNFVLHHCDNPPCCNPAHLYDGTQKQNTQDCIKRGRWRVPSKKSPLTKLTKEQATFIRGYYVKGRRGDGKFLAKKFNVSISLVRQVARGVAWRNLDTHLSD